MVVLFNGRPLTLSQVDATSPAILEAWFGGIEAGNAVADAVFGKINPGGKLPVSFPRNVGQVPIYYNHQPTGRPCDATSKYNSRHRDILSCDPLYAFGYGLSYTTFRVSNLQLGSTTATATGPTMDARHGTVWASVDVTNTGTRAGDDVAQLYIHPGRDQPVAAGAAARGLPARYARAGPHDDGDLATEGKRRWLLRQRRTLPGRERDDRGLRGRQLKRIRQPRDI